MIALGYRSELTVSIELELSTKMFGKLADPNGANNALSQVLYGLALRYVIHRPTFSGLFI